MIWTRRRFLAAASLLPCAAVATSRATDPAAAAATPQVTLDGPAYLVGDPYLATADDCGLGGQGFADARERAFRFRTPAFERDRLALGLELDRA